MKTRFLGLIIIVSIIIMYANCSSIPSSLRNYSWNYTFSDQNANPLEQSVIHTSNSSTTVFGEKYGLGVYLSSINNRQVQQSEVQTLVLVKPGEYELQLHFNGRVTLNPQSYMTGGNVEYIEYTSIVPTNVTIKLLPTRYYAVVYDGNIMYESRSAIPQNITPEMLGYAIIDFTDENNIEIVWTNNQYLAQGIVDKLVSNSAFNVIRNQINKD